MLQGHEQFVGANLTSEHSGHGRHTGIADSAGDDLRVGIEGIVAVEGETVHGDRLGDTDADGRDLVFTAGFTDPYSGTPGNLHSSDAEAGQYGDEQALQPTHIADDIDGFGEVQYGIPHELPGTVPGDLASPVRIDDGGTVGGAFLWLGAFSGRVHGGMLQEDHGVRFFSGDDGTVDCALELKALNIRHGVGA